MDSKPHPDMESQKRRTTRIVQAVPLTVTGVDALGRPFQELTSTLIINCHGCRDQSTHDVLKNMWVTLEVPHNESGREPRTVRGRVTWIQRPRTVRELFQIGVELEVPGNVWGIAFPPGDWFPFPEQTPNLEIPAPAEEAEASPPVSQWLVNETPAPPEPIASEPPEDKIRVLPPPAGTDASLQLARQVARMVVEAKQQLQGTAREAASRAIAEETAPLIAALQNQMKDAADRSVAEAIAAHLGREQTEKKNVMQGEMEASIASLQADWAREMDQRLAEARQRMDSQLEEMERSRQADFEERIQSQIQLELEKHKGIGGFAGTNAGEGQPAIAALREKSAEAAADEARRWQELMSQETSEARLHMA
ncbi:MAG: hypothetical protein ACRD4Y_16665, partial [Candidatus Acidiferrales bacterium]